ncbi:Diphthamide biosynthesis protein (fragment) [groundwater metagenome]|uniref:Diphthamide biosynthesis protein n=1 Tax=groundwater metagenome TaxID=717931 RepID=A0A098E9J7_9ZZZZ
MEDNNNRYDFEIENIIEKINKGNFKLVGLQFPEGLKKSAVRIAGEIETKTQAKTIIFIDPTYGACDIKLSDVNNLNIELLVHFGHEKFK